MAEVAHDQLLEKLLELADDSCVFVLPHAVRLAVELGVAEQLAAGPLDAEYVAGELGLHPDPVRRLLRALASIGLFEQRGPGFALTPTGRRLLPNEPGSVAASVCNPES